MDIVRLRNGGEVSIRPIRPDDGPELKAGYDRLSPESKYRRFLVAKPHLTAADARYLVDVDGSDHVAVVATPLCQQRTIVAVGRFVRLPEDPRTAEFAIVVGDRFQGQGLATEVLTRLAEAALERGIVRFRATLLADNPGAHRLVRSFSGRPVTERHAGPVDELEIELAA